MIRFSYRDGNGSEKADELSYGEKAFPKGIPPAVKGLKVSSSNGSPVISWQSGGEPTFAFVVIRGPEATMPNFNPAHASAPELGDGAPDQVIYVGHDLSFVDSESSNGQVLYYKVVPRSSSLYYGAAATVQFNPLTEGLGINSDCAEGEVNQRACGINGNGLESQVCSGGSFGEWEACIDLDSCANGSTSSTSCGLNGSGAMSLTCVNGQRSNSGSCSDPDQCQNGSTSNTTCGLNNRGSQALLCKNGRWSTSGSCSDPDQCRNGSSSSTSCGLNNRGSQALLCQNGRWSNSGSCSDPDQCRDGATKSEACGYLNFRTQKYVCQGGRWVTSGGCNF